MVPSCGAASPYTPVSSACLNVTIDDRMANIRANRTEFHAGGSRRRLRNSNGRVSTILRGILAHGIRDPGGCSASMHLPPGYPEGQSFGFSKRKPVGVVNFWDS